MGTFSIGPSLGFMGFTPPEVVISSREQLGSTSRRPRSTRLSLAPGQSLLHYQLIEQIGAGGMGVVYSASDTKLRHEPVHLQG